MAIAFYDSPVFPLPSDYDDLVTEGKRLARVNAASLRGTPELQVASWAFFRQHYLFPTPPGMFYEHGVVSSPLAHSRWVHFWASHRLTALAAPRGFSKSTLLNERTLQDIVTRPYYKVVGFHSILTKVQKAVSKLMLQIDGNERIIQDFGKLKPGRADHGSWNKHHLALKNGSQILGIPIEGASLGERPNRIYFDDPEDPRDHETNPTQSLEEFREFVLSFVIPMATNSSVSIQFVNTNYTRRTFSFWMHKTEDPRIVECWHRLLEKAEWVNQKGEREYLWAEGITPEFLAEQKKIMGAANYAANYLNEPGTESERILTVHPNLCTYRLIDPDKNAYERPLASSAKVETCQLTAWRTEQGGVQFPEWKKFVRPWSQVVNDMRRFIMVDYADTTTNMSDYCVVHVLGFENSEVHKDTLWSLDCWAGRVRLEELTRHIYRLAKKWAVPWVGVEAYSVQGDYAERVAMDLPGMFGGLEVAPRVLPVKFPPKMTKADKIKRMEWRFVQFRVKLPSDYSERPDPMARAAYTMLYDQIDNFTEDLKLLDHDDVLDSLAMHQAFGKSRTPPLAPDMVRMGNAWELLSEGKDELEDGVPIMPGSLPLGQLTVEQLRKLRERNREEVEDDYVDWLSIPL